MNASRSTHMKIGHALARFLTEASVGQSSSPPTPRHRLLAMLRPGDVLLVEGRSRISAAIKYLTQSTWSHAALYVGALGSERLAAPNHCFVEADLVEGVRSIGVDEYDGLHTRICRPVDLTESETAIVVDYMIGRIGHRYDLRNVFDLARYLLPYPPIPARFRRRMIALGSGDPTRAICSTLIAQAFEAISYPVLPHIDYLPAPTPDSRVCIEEVLRVRHHTLFAPRDFDVSPYFRLIKPTIDGGFNFRALQWHGAAE